MVVLIYIYIYILCYHSYLLHVVPLHWSRSFVSHVTSCAAKKKYSKVLQGNAHSSFCILHISTYALKEQSKEFLVLRVHLLGFQEVIQIPETFNYPQANSLNTELSIKKNQTHIPDSDTQYYIPYVFDNVSRNRSRGRPPPAKHQGNV